jgi:uncharacterized membrane protein
MITIITGIVCFLAGLFIMYKIMVYGIYLKLANGELKITEKGMAELNINKDDK